MLSCIIPCYNEEDVIELFYSKISSVLYDREYELIFVNDGSKDKTLQIIRGLAEKDIRVKYISFSRNFGKEAAMLAGFKMCQGEYVAILDADLQHPPEKLINMIEALDLGYDIAAARRVNRIGEDKMKSFLSSKFYLLMNKLVDIEVKDGAQDFRVMKRKVVQAILEMPEYHRFSKGIFTWVGFKTKWFEHENVERPLGNSKWNFSKLFKYAIDGIIAFSTVPLKMSLFLGTVTSSIGFLYAFIIIVNTLINDADRDGYASLMCTLLIIGGVILICLGILGEYISRIYIEVKHRPIFIIDETNIDIIRSNSINDR